VTEFHYTDMLPLGPDETPYRLLTTEGVREVTSRSCGASSTIRRPARTIASWPSTC
jgi:hypothetical protein